MTPNQFQKRLTAHLKNIGDTFSTKKGDWVVKGFIDVYKNIYTISDDTKVISKIFELMLIPIISNFATKNRLKMVLSEHQNHYPDITFVFPKGSKIALDLKSTYRINNKEVNGFTLGAFTGYFRNREMSKNITFPYGQYAAHFVLGNIYSRTVDKTDERRVHSLKNLQNIVSVVRDFTFVVQEKWRIASDRPGSGNTKNIGSVKEINALVKGKGPFSAFSEKVFDDYWMYYMTKDMARAIDSKIHYKNLEEYRQWRRQSKIR